ncbi:MltA domain-containing protein [bacterium]|nr:MltA domain-containing protein [bacterium]
MKFRSLVLVLALGLVSCTRTPVKDRFTSLRRVVAPDVADDIGRADLVRALEEHARFQASIQPPSLMRFGAHSILSKDYAQALQDVVVFSAQTPDDGVFFQEFAKRFEFYEVYGGPRWGEVLLTSYYAAEIPGSPVRTAQFDTPLLGRPADLVEVPTGQYDDRFADVGSMRGRLQRDKARGRDQLLPYYSRSQIQQGALGKRKLELAWVDALDAFFMQIQGSGTIVLPNERLRLGYSDQNGHLYQSIGKFLTDVIPLEKLTLSSIEKHLRSLPAQERDAVLNRNPSYVFFEKIEGDPKTSFGNGVFSGRTIAVDARYFPKGSLAFLSFKKPLFESPEAEEPSGWEDVGRFVIDQDTGGAIRGGGRTDLFWGAGDEAKRHAGFIKGPARLLYLAPRIPQ